MKNMHALLFLAGVMALATTPAARAEPGLDGDKEIEWGIGAKLRRWHVSGPVQRVFVDATPGRTSGNGAGIDFSRRTGQLEVSFGFGIDELNGRDGYYLEKGADPLEVGNVDYIVFDDLKWFTAEVVVVNHARIHKFLEFRFGAGLGIGLLRGELRKTDAVCTSAALKADCMHPPPPELQPVDPEIDKPADLPPVLPVINALVGLELRPFDFIRISVDVGIHTTPYVGVGASLYLW